jgi:hypothetical protein
MDWKSMSQPNIEWIKRRKELLNNIKKFEPTGDRLEKTTQINYMHNAMHESIVGFSGWLNGWVSVELTKKINVNEGDMPTLTDKELLEVFEKFQDISTKLLELDIDVTDNVTKKVKKKKSNFFTKQSEENQSNHFPMVV